MADDAPVAFRSDIVAPVLWRQASKPSTPVCEFERPIGSERQDGAPVIKLEIAFAESLSIEENDPSTASGNRLSYRRGVWILLPANDQAR